MRRIAFLMMAALFVAPGVFAQGQSPQCQRVQFSEQVLERFPNAPEECLDVITRDGQQYAVFKADLIRTANNGVRVRMKKPDGSFGESRFIRTSPQLRVLVDGDKVRVRDLAVGQTLTAYVKVTEPVIALAPESETVALQLVPLEAADTRVAAADAAPADSAPAPAPAESPQMPETASSLPEIGAAGAVLITLGALFVMARRKMREQ
jgi:hypothetical protein